jgi:hypothetical protein
MDKESKQRLLVVIGASVALAAYLVDSRWREAVKDDQARLAAAHGQFHQEQLAAYTNSRISDLSRHLDILLEGSTPPTYDKLIELDRNTVSAHLNQSFLSLTTSSLLLFDLSDNHKTLDAESTALTTLVLNKTTFLNSLNPVGLKEQVSADKTIRDMDMDLSGNLGSRVSKFQDDVLGEYSRQVAQSKALYDHYSRLSFWIFVLGWMLSAYGELKKLEEKRKPLPGLE